MNDGSRLATRAMALLAFGWLTGVGLPALSDTPEADDDGITVEDALEVPADPDDALDIADDNDPNDVGQEALEPAGDDDE